MKWIMPFVTLVFAATALCAEGQLPAELEAIRIEQRLGNPVPLDLSFRDEQGSFVELSRYVHDRPVILVLAYYRCPRLCSEVLNGLADSLQRVPFVMGKDYELVIVSFDDRETPRLAAEKKKSYVEHYGIPGMEAGCHFLTGRRSNIKTLAEAVGFKFVYDPERNLFQHAAGIMVLTPGGKVARYFFGIQFSPRDLRLGLVEASEGKIGSAVDQALLLGCLSYDPKTGTYAVAAMKIMRLGGIVTALLLAMYLGVSWRRERRSHTASRIAQTCKVDNVRPAKPTSAQG
jgi:protein SCO1/2